MAKRSTIYNSRNFPIHIGSKLDEDVTFIYNSRNFPIHIGRGRFFIY